VLKVSTIVLATELHTPVNFIAMQLSDRVAAVLAEFVGTFLFALSVTCALRSQTPSEWVPATVGFAYMALVYCFGHVSGGHLNPAVTIAAVLSGKKSLALGACYIVVQSCAGAAAGISSKALYGGEVSLGSPDYEGWQAMTAEVFYVAMLAFVALSVTSRRNSSEKNPNQFYGLAMGLVVLAGSHATSQISGAVLNPAVSLALSITKRPNIHDMPDTHDLPDLPDLPDTPDASWLCFCYMCYQALGAGFATFLFRVTRREDFMSEEQASDYVASLSTRLASEFIGTFALVATVGLCVLSNSWAVPVAAGAIISSMSYAVGDISGGHFNPAITLAVFLCRKVDITCRDTFCYMIFQLLAGILAALFYTGIFTSRTFPLEPRPPFTQWAAYTVEAMFTCLLALVVLSTAYAKSIKTQLKRNYYYGLAIGSCVTAAGFVSTSVSGGLVNPAVAWGISISHFLNGGKLYYALTYSSAELMGAIAAVVVFAATRPEVYLHRPKGLLYGGSQG